MPENDRPRSTGNRSLNRRLVSSFPGLLVFAAMVYFSVVSFHDGLSHPHISILMRLPFFLFSGVTVFVGLIALRPLFPSKRQEGDSKDTRVVVNAIASKDEPNPGQRGSGEFIVNALLAAFSIFMFTCSAVIFTLLLQSPSAFGLVGLVVFGVIATVMLIASLKWPVRTIRRKLTSNGADSNRESTRPLWKRILAASLSFCFALLQTLAVSLYHHLIIGVYHDEIFALIFIALCWLCACFLTWDLVRYLRQPEGIRTERIDTPSQSGGEKSS